MNIKHRQEANKIDDRLSGYPLTPEEALKKALSTSPPGKPAPEQHDGGEDDREVENA